MDGEVEMNSFVANIGLTEFDGVPLTHHGRSWRPIRSKNARSVFLRPNYISLAVANCLNQTA